MCESRSLHLSVECRSVSCKLINALFKSRSTPFFVLGFAVNDLSHRRCRASGEQRHRADGISEDARMDFGHAFRILFQPL
jgi:hypothetical protein